MENFASQIVNTGVEAMLGGLFGSLLAQAVKLMLNTIIKRKLDFRVLTTTGGMPSSHSAGVCALSTIIGIITGFTSPIFAVSVGYAFIVMYDAAGIRRASGKMAVCLNKMMSEFYKHDINAAGTKLKELLGHTPKEVFCGALFGIAFAFWFHYIFLL